MARYELIDTGISSIGGKKRVSSASSIAIHFRARKIKLRGLLIFRKLTSIVSGLILPTVSKLYYLSENEKHSLALTVGVLKSAIEKNINFLN